MPDALQTIESLLAVTVVAIYREMFPLAKLLSSAGWRNCTKDYFKLPYRNDADSRLPYRYET
jgi:biotin synthase-like enzyme